MKSLFHFALICLIVFSCGSRKSVSTTASSSANDTVRIANDELQYEIIIIDPGFNSWFVTRARPRDFYTQNYLEMRNRSWVGEWNRRANLPDRHNTQLFDMQINYDTHTDYGYEVNYMLYYYLTYFQLKNKVQLGGFVPQI